MLQKKIDWLNNAQETLDIEFKDFQLGILLANRDAITERGEGKSFALACKTVMECEVSEEPINIGIITNTEFSSKLSKERISYISKHNDKHFLLDNNHITINDSNVYFYTKSQIDRMRGIRFKYVLIDDLNLFSPITDRLWDNVLSKGDGKIIIYTGTRSDE